MQQGSSEWFAARCGKATASRFKDILAKGRGNKPSATREEYILNVAIERITGSPGASYTNAAMERGTELEPHARLAYEAHRGTIVEEVAIIDHADLMASCSPDGLVGDDGGVEIKCPTKYTRHIDALRRMPPEHIPQVQGSMWIADRQWWDFVSYHPDFPPGLQLLVHRIERDEAFINNLEAEVRKFLGEVDRKVEELQP